MLHAVAQGIKGGREAARTSAQRDQGGHLAPHVRCGRHRCNEMLYVRLHGIVGMLYVQPASSAHPARRALTGTCCRPQRRTGTQQAQLLPGPRRQPPAQPQSPGVPGSGLRQPRPQPRKQPCHGMTSSARSLSPSGLVVGGCQRHAVAVIIKGSSRHSVAASLAHVSGARGRAASALLCCVARVCAGPA